MIISERSEIIAQCPNQTCCCSPVADDPLDGLIRVLANATRRKILGLCSNGYVSAGDIAAHIDLSLASVSEHLKVLRKCGLVELERTGTNWMYCTRIDALNKTLEQLALDLPPTRRGQP